MKLPPALCKVHAVVFSSVRGGAMLHDFYEIFRDCGVLCAELCVKIPGDLVKGFQSSGIKNLWESSDPQILSAP